MQKTNVAFPGRTVESDAERRLERISLRTTQMVQINSTLAEEKLY